MVLLSNAKHARQALLTAFGAILFLVGGCAATPAAADGQSVETGLTSTAAPGFHARRVDAVRVNNSTPARSDAKAQGCCLTSTASPGFSGHSSAASNTGAKPNTEGKAIDIAIDVAIKPGLISINSPGALQTILASPATIVKTENKTATPDNAAPDQPKGAGTTAMNPAPTTQPSGMTAAVPTP